MQQRRVGCSLSRNVGTAQVSTAAAAETAQMPVVTKIGMPTLLQKYLL